jgi:hypothetical protein
MAEPHKQAAGPASDNRNPIGPQTWGGALALMLVLLVLALVLVRERHSPPAPRSADAPAAEFSAARAREMLQKLVGDGRPHPVGSAADDRVRAQILATLTGLGLQPHVEEGFACHRLGTCAQVKNVVAQIDGREPGAAVAMAAHYDSVPAGPGASDDLAGVAAILEIARALRAGPPLRHPVVLLLDEGEEAGLLGAAAFEESGTEAAAVRAVVNLEARGTNGPSFMFETSGDNGWMIDSWAPRVARPVTTSVAAFIYTLLPNDTDLTVFRHRRVAGLNFAFIGGVANYHTPGDNFANSSPASLQHQGDNALAAVTGLAEADLANPPRGNQVYFDLLSLGIVRWPLGWTLWLALAALLLVLAATIAGLRRGAQPLRGGDLVLGLLVVPAAAVLTALVAYGLALGLTPSGALSVAWLAHPGPAITAFWLLGLAVVAARAVMLGRGAPPQALWGGIWLVWAVAGVALAVIAPAVSYIFVAPALVAGVCGALPGIWRAPWKVAAAVIVPAVAAALTWLGVVPAIYDGMGSPVLPVTAVLVALMVTPAAPLIAAGGGLGRRLWLAALVLSLLAAVMAMTQPRFTAASPEPITYVLYQNGDSGAAQWVVLAPPSLPPAVRQAANFGPPGPPFPWAPQASGRSAPAAALPGVTAPDLEVLSSTTSGGKRHLRLRLISHRGAAVASIQVPNEAQAEAVIVAGHEVPEQAGKAGTGAPGAGGFHTYSDLTLPAVGCEIEMTLGNPAPLTWYVIDSTPGLPPAGAALLAARPATAQPIQQGDRTVVARKVTI